MPQGSTTIHLCSLAFAAALSWPLAAAAEVATDGTLGRKVRLSGKHVEIGDDLGRIQGANLFHSFERFNIDTGGSVTFMGPAGLKNVIGRVTGGERSSIDGTLRSSIEGADLWLLNPAGILFGPNAWLDVKGSFHASTADELRFSDGATFSALDSRGSRLSVAAPEAFGFLGQRPAAITTEHSELTIHQPGKALSLIGGDIGIRGGKLESVAGTLTLVALSGAGSATVATGMVEGMVSGNVRVDGGANPNTEGDGGGTIRIRAGRVTITEGAKVDADNFGSTDSVGGVLVDADILEIDNGGQISAATFAEGGAGSIIIRAQEIDLQDRGVIRSSTSASGDAGTVAVDAERLFIEGIGNNDPFTGISASTFGEAEDAGDAGTVTVRAGDLELRNAGQIRSFTGGAGDAGRVDVTADRLLVEGVAGASTGIFSNTEFGSAGAGNAGTIMVRAGDLELRNQGSIASLTGGSGNAGTITVDANRLRVEGLIGTNTFSDTDNAGDAGTITVNVGNLELRNTGQISSFTGGAGDAGTIAVTADRLFIEGIGANDSTDDSFTGIRASAFSVFDNAGSAGVINVRAGVLELRNAGQIVSSTGGPGDAGTIVVDADQLFIEGIGNNDPFTGISASTFGEADDAGDAGTVTVRAGDLELRNAGQIRSFTGGAGDAGRVDVTADRLFIDGFGLVEASTGIFSNTEFGSAGAGNAGTIMVQAGGLELRNQGSITSSTKGPGNAGMVIIDANRIMTVAGGTIATDSSGSGVAGDVIIRAPRVVIQGDGAIASAGRGPGRAGNVRVEPGDLLVEDARISTEGASAAGGRIDIVDADLIHLVDAEVTSNGRRAEEAQSLIRLEADTIVLNDSRVTSLTDGVPIAGSGVAQLRGDVTVISTDSLVAATSSVVTTGVQADIGTGLQLPAGAFVDVGRLLRESCAARASNQRSSFTRANRGGLPPSPDRLLPSVASDVIEASLAQTAESRLDKEGELVEICGG